MLHCHPGRKGLQGLGKKNHRLVLGPVRVMAQISVRFARILFGYLDLYLLASQLLIFSISWLLLRDYPRLSISPTGWCRATRLRQCQAQSPWEAPSPSNVICLRFINESINEVPVRTDVRECAINVWYVNTARHALRFIITRGPSWPSRRIETRSF